jgi:hypothetical protein
VTDETLSWSVEDHLRNGEASIAEIGPVDPKDARVCFHLTPITYDESEPWSDQASYNLRAKPLFDALGLPLDIDYVGGTSGIEAWETAVPTVSWLHARVPALAELANAAGLEFGGWSFEPREPRNASYVSCGPSLNVVNRYSPEGQAAIDELMAIGSKSKVSDQ